MKSVGDAAKAATAGFDQMGKAATSGFDGFAQKVDSVSDDLTKVGTGFTAFGAGITAAIGIGVNQFAKLEQAMANVASIAGGADIGAMTDQVRSLAVELGTSPTGLAEGLYDLISSGIDAADAMDVLRTSAIAAKAGLTDTGTASRAITAVLNAYSMEAKEAGNVSDVLFNTVNEGVISFEGLANNLQNVIPLAASLNIGIEEVGAAFKELTLQGFSAATAETGIAAVMRSAINPTEELTRAVQELGYANVETLVQAEGLAGLLFAIEEASGGSSTAMMELLGTSEATTAVLALLSDGALNFAASAEDMKASMQDGQTTMAVFETQMDTLQGSFSRMRAALGEIMLGAGEVFAPLVRGAADAVTQVAIAFDMLPSGVQTTVATLGGLAGAASLAAGGMLILLPKLVEFRAAVMAISGGRGIMAVTASLGAYGAAAAAAGAVGLVLGASIAGVVDAFMDGESATERLSNAFNALASGDVIGFFEALRGEAQAATNELADVGTLLMDLIDQGAKFQAQGDTVTGRYIRDVGRMNMAVMQLNSTMLDTDELQQRAFNATYAQGGVGFEEELSRLREEYTLTGAEITAYTETVEALSRAYLDPTVNLEALLARQQDLKFAYEEDILTLDQYNLALADLAREYGLLPAVAGEATASVSQMTDVLFAQVPAAMAARDQMAANREEWLAWNAEVVAGVTAIGGWDNALSQLNITGLTGDMGMLAENTIRAGQAFDNTFRVLVTNVQGLGQGIQQATDWMADLVTVNDEGWSKVGSVVAEQRISWEEGEAAVAAYNDTLARNYDIQQNLVAIQAMQAPYIAEQVAATQAYVQELANMDAQQQRVALSFMDMQTVGTAMEIITLGNSAAFDEMGASGEAAFTQMIQGALQVNPMLFNVLETMGIINGTPMDFTVDFSALEAAGSEIDRLITSVDNLVDTLREIHGLEPIAPEVDTSQIDAAASEGGPVGHLRSMLSGLDQYRATPSVDVDGDGAYTDVDNIVTRLADIDGTTATATVNVQAGSAAVGDGTGGASNWRDMLGLPPEGTTETITVDIQTTGTETIDTATQQIAEMSDKTVTVTINAEASSIGDIFELLRSIESAGAATLTVDVVIGTNELDTGLTQFGIGTGGGGGAAGFTAPSVSVDIVIGTNELDTAFTTETNPTVTVNVDANVGQAQMQIDSLGGFGDAPAVTIMVTADTSAASEALLGLAAAAQVASGMSVSIPVTTPGAASATTALNGVTAAAQAIPTSELVSVSAPGAGEATAMLDAVTSAAQGIPSSESVSVSVFGADSAIGALQGVANAAASIPSSVSTTVTTNVVTAYSTIGSPSGGRLSAFADGGYVRTPFAIVGEDGPELVQLPYGSYVHPADETARMLARRDEGYAIGGSSGRQATSSDTPPITIGPIYVQGSVTAEDDLAVSLTRKIVPAVVLATKRQERGQGVRA